MNARHNKLGVTLLGRLPDGSPAAAVTDIRDAIRRWVRGFHAALYREYLPAGATFATYPPLPEGRRIGDRIAFTPVSAAHTEFVKELKRNRTVGDLDRIVCRNETCRYECVWSQVHDGRWICIYGLDLYNWRDLGSRNQPARGCVGCYRRPTGGVPSNGSTATRLVFHVGTTSPLDPFGG